MGSGKEKAHEAFVIAPAAAVATLEGPDSVLDVAGDADDDAVEVADAADTAVEVDDGGPPTAQDTPPDASPAAHLTQVPTLSPQDLEVVTPVPESVAVGDVAGHPLIVGGSDIDDSLLTLVAYDSAGGPREVLYGWVNPEAEDKLLEALALDEEKLVPVEVTKQVEGRLPIDEQHQLYEQVEKIAKSVNHHLKAEDGIPQHTHENLAELEKTLEELKASATDDEKQMLSAYEAAASQLAERMSSDYAVPYDQGGKVPFVNPHTVQATVTVTEMVPAPSEDVADGLLPATIRDATRIKPTLDADGHGSWDGTSRYAGQSGKEYRVDLGDGYEAVYRPHVVGSKKDHAAVGQRGFLELVAPQGAGHGPELVRRLEQLNLVNRPMTAAEAEWTYLTRNVWAQRLDKHDAVASAMTEARTLDDTVTELVFAEKADQAIDLDDAQLDRFAKAIRLEAEARALPLKTKLIRDTVATQLGFADGEALRASAGYDPTPRRSAGWYVWDRFDVAADAAATAKAFGNRVLYHRVTGNNIADMLTNSGALVATERRRVMGIRPGLGMSESSDMTSGGSRVVDLRAGNKPSKGPYLVWDDPSRLLRRSDWYAYDGDHFAASSDEGSWSTSGQTRDPAKVATFMKSSNEVLFRNGIDLLGHEAPDRIKCANKTQRKQVLNVLVAKGVTHLAGKPIEEVVT